MKRNHSGGALSHQSDSDADVLCTTQLCEVNNASKLLDLSDEHYNKLADILDDQQLSLMRYEFDSPVQLALTVFSEDCTHCWRPRLTGCFNHSDVAHEVMALLNYRLGRGLQLYKWLHDVYAPFTFGPCCKCGPARDAPVRTLHSARPPAVLAILGWE